MPAGAPVCRLLLVILMTLAAGSAFGYTGMDPVFHAVPSALPTPADKPFRGTIALAVDATDTDHQIFVVHETLPVQQPGDVVLLYPQWETASHAPTASIADLAGLVVHVDGKRMEWRRDAIDMHAFHVSVPEDARSITLDFQFLAPPSASLLRPNMVKVPWHRMLLYPAGWYVRAMPIAATLAIPDGLHAFTSLNYRQSANELAFSPVTLEQLVDAPVYAGRYWKRIDLSADTAKRVDLDILADVPADLAITPMEIGKMRMLIKQTLAVFGPAPYRHYDAILTLSDVLSPGGGIEHREEGENNLPADYFIDATHQLDNRDLVAHELVHAWNGRWRVPADLWSPNFNLPVRGSLLWVYEGQTEFWGRVLAARSGLRDRQQTLDKLALDAAIVANRPGRSWKTLADSTNDAVYMAGHSVRWRDWQRREDYYAEGVLLWLDVDARLRQLSGERWGLDDFARRFFAAHGDDQGMSTYTFDDVCRALDALVPDDWRAFLDVHLHTHETGDAIAGLARAGWKLVYRDVPTETFRQDESDAGASDLDYSIGMQVRQDGTVRSVAWDGPSFRAGLSAGMRIVEVDGKPFTTTALTDAITASTTRPLVLGIDAGERRRVVRVPYRGALRYPSLERIRGTPDRLSALLEAR